MPDGCAIKVLKYIQLIVLAFPGIGNGQLPLGVIHEFATTD